VGVGRQILDEIDGVVDHIAQTWHAKRGRMYGTSKRPRLIVAANESDNQEVDAARREYAIG
jgi:hypothetical protein